MEKKRLLKPREEKLMMFLWEHYGPLTTDEMNKRLNHDEWTFITLNKTVKSLYDMGYIRVNGIELHNTQWARKFEPTMTKEEYFAYLLHEKGISASTFGDVALAMIGNTSRKQSNSKDMIKALENTIERINNNYLPCNKEK